MASASLSLRRMTPADLPLMHRWANAPHVVRWWREGGSLASVSANYLPMIEGTDPTVALIVELDSVPIGHAQFGRWGDFPDDAARFDARADDYCIDYFIGDAALCGQGLGTQLIARLVEYVRDDVPAPGPAGFLVDVEAANRPSCRVLEKNGFTASADPHPDRPTDGGGPILLFRRPA